MGYSWLNVWKYRTPKEIHKTRSVRNVMGSDGLVRKFNNFDTHNNFSIFHDPK